MAKVRRMEERIAHEDEAMTNAENEELIKEHAERSGGVATEITEISTVIKHNTSVVS